LLPSREAGVDATKLDTEIENRRASILRAELTIADAELATNNSVYTDKAVFMLRQTLRGEKAIFAKLEKYRADLI
jgi:hypothetical protein